MIIRKTMLYGNSVNDNLVPVPCSAPLVSIPGVAGGKRVSISLSEELLHMHVLLMGGTGSGKTNTFRHILPQIQSRMTTDDVMLVFDSKRANCEVERTVLRSKTDAERCERTD